MSCTLGDRDNCAHEASKYLGLKSAGTGQEKVVDGMYRCGCGAVLRAKELRDKSTSKAVTSTDSAGTYLVYQQRNSDGKGHVYVIETDSKGNKTNHGNGNYNWAGADTTAYYKVK
jgi:hypothetical protein